jgi:hypothetical protein
MFKSLKIVGRIALAFALLLFPATQWLKPANSAADGKGRQVDSQVANQRTPVVITKVTLGETIVQAGRMFLGQVDPITPFTAGDDWIQNLTLYLYNRTNKTIVYTSVQIVFPETGELTPPRGFLLRLGRVPPPIDVLFRPTDRPPILFLPGQTMVIRLGDYIDQIKSEVEPVFPLAAATKLKIYVESSYFADGMLTFSDAYWSADPQDPGKQLRIGPDYFPGDWNLSWPGRRNFDGSTEGKKKL